MVVYCCIVFLFNDTATTEIYTLSLHDALPIYPQRGRRGDPADAGRRARPAPGRPDLGRLRAVGVVGVAGPERLRRHDRDHVDRKSTRLNSSHANISYAVFCLKKKISA